MVLPLHIFDAAKSGDRDAVFAWLDNQDDSGRVVGDARDVNEHCEGGGSVLMAAASQIDSAAKLAFVWELVGRGADLGAIVQGPDYQIGVFEMAVSGASLGRSRPELFRDFVLQWLAREPDLALPRVAAEDRSRLRIVFGFIFQIFVRGHSSRPVAEVVFALVRAGARVLAYDRGNLEENETRCPALATDEHWLACKGIILGVRAAGSWRAYARLPRKRVLRLRSLMLRGRAKPRRTGAPNVVARTFKLPNEMVWKVLAFWRVESEVTGEVI